MKKTRLKIQLFNQMAIDQQSSELLFDLFSCFKFLQKGKNSVIFEEDCVADENMFFIVSGKVGVYKRLEFKADFRQTEDEREMQTLISTYNKMANVNSSESFLKTSLLEGNPLSNSVNYG